ncbi:MAG: hypothetical protein IT423_04275 [Pirellulaceae bacterium]|nr:hypothetical protein [Pirellulaceae bacterium]
MADTTETFQGILQGQSIKLDRPPSLPDGSKVKVTVRKAKLSIPEREAKLKELFGGCSQDAADLERFME